ncbi:hypothetical protein [Gramella sp. AN32]|uniref:DUF4878 domain-containing protein n=1 Tax=Christiangramia antarctica TaxID=2058158 RepID=A0ABW5X918_9FLAO|nr:hypothetical protein [Gramella sp. AN32]MCM4157594.1 hypothetical protein [Gramella sp. AN32]
MKKLICFFILISTISCSENDQMSHTETAKLVAESFINKDNSSLEKYTTPQPYRSLVSVQEMVTSAYSGNTNFKVVRDTVCNDMAWVKFTTSHEQKPETFKMIKQDGHWKVTETGLRERSPF